MQRAQRTFGRFLKRTPNEADVEAMLTDFTESEQMLEKVCRITARHSPWQERPTRLPLHTHEQAGSLFHAHPLQQFQPTRTFQEMSHPYAHRVPAAIIYYHDPPPTNPPSSKHPPSNGATRGQTSSTTSWPPSSTCTPSTSHWAVKRPREAHMSPSRRHMPHWSVSLPSRRPSPSSRRT